MENQEILDDELVEKKDITRTKIVQWWERKRILYNGLLLGTEILIMLYFWRETISYGVSFAIFQTIIVNIIANIFYTAGWVLEILLSYYLKISFPSAFKKVLFVLGTLFSLALAAIAYIAGLSMFINDGF